MRNLNVNIASGEPGIEPTESAAFETAVEAGRSGTVVRGGGASPGLVDAPQPANMSAQASAAGQPDGTRWRRGIERQPNEPAGASPTPRRRTGSGPRSR